MGISTAPITSLHGNGIAHSSQPDVDMVISDSNVTPSKIYSLAEPPFEGFKPIDRQGFRQTRADTAIVIDHGQ